MMTSDRSEYAVRKFQTSWNCAQSVFSAFTSETALDEQLSLRIACAFGGGMGLRETCGAVTGALMTIGLRCGSKDASDEVGGTAAIKLARDRFNELFKSKNGSLHCAELIRRFEFEHCNDATCEESVRHEMLCTELVRNATQIVEQLLNEQMGDAVTPP